MDLRVLPDVLVGGLAAGAVYALMALGLVLIYKTTDVVNFGHGDMATVSTFVAYALAVQAGWPVLAAALLAMGFAALLGAAVELGLLQPARLRHASVLGLVVVTLGVGLTLNGLAGIVWGHDVKSFPFLLTGPPLRAGQLTIPVDQLLNLAAGVALAAALYLFFRFSDLGVAMRAVLSNRTAAQLVGIPIRWVFALSWALGSVLGAVAGILAAPLLYLEPNRMVDLLLRGFAAAVLGGMDSLPGAVLGGALLGVLENLAGTYGSIDLKASLAFVVIVLVLVVRPHGLLGAGRVRRV